jgi:hypothetical protein
MHSDKIDKLISSMKSNESIECKDSFADKVLSEFSARNAVMNNIKFTVSLVATIIILNLITVLYMADSYSQKSADKAYYIESVKNIYDNNIYIQYLATAYRDN